MGQNILNILNAHPYLVWLIPASIILFFLIIIFLIICFPFIRKHVEQLKIGSNEIKFRPFSYPERASIDEVLAEIKSWKEGDETDKKLMSRIVDLFCDSRADLYNGVMDLSLLITALQRTDVKNNLGEKQEDILQSLYMRLDYTISKYFYLKKPIIILADTINSDKKQKTVKRLEKYEKYILNRILECQIQIPKKYRKFDYEKFKETL